MFDFSIFKKAILMMCVLFIFSCSSPVSSTIDTDKEELVKKYGVDISQEDSIIIEQIESNLKAYYKEMGSYRVILTGNPKDYTKNEIESLYILTIKAVMKVVNAGNIDLDISNINFKDGSISEGMFSGDVIEGSENIFINFVFPNDKIKTIGTMSFMALYNTEEIIIPNSVTIIDEMAFQLSQSLIKITLGDSLQEIGNYAFMYVPGLKEIIIPNSVKKIGMGAFSGSALRKLELSSSLESIGNGAFTYLETTELTIPSSVTSIGDQAFAFSKKLTTLIYLGKTPTNIKNIGKDVFFDCVNLTTLIVPNAEDYNDDGWKTFLGASFKNVGR